MTEFLNQSLDNNAEQDKQNETSLNDASILAEMPNFDQHMKEVEERKHQPSRASSFIENREIAKDRGQNIVEARSLAKKTENIRDLSYEDQKKFYLDQFQKLKEEGKTDKEISDFMEEFDYAQSTGGKIRTSEDIRDFYGQRQAVKPDYEAQAEANRNEIPIKEAPQPGTQEFDDVLKDLGID